MAERQHSYRYALREAKAAHWCEHIRHLAPIADFDPSAWEDLKACAQMVHCRKGDFVFQTDQYPDEMYLICQGHIKIYYNTADGREQIFYIYGPRDFIGGLNMLEDKPYAYMGQAADDSVICAIPRQFCERHMLNNVQVLRRLLNKSFERIRWAEDLIQRLATNDAAMKVASLLYSLAKDFGHRTPEGIRIDLSLNREEMGAYAGLTRETMTRKLGELREKGDIEFIGSRSLLIRDLEAFKWAHMTEAAAYLTKPSKA